MPTEAKLQEDNAALRRQLQELTEAMESQSLTECRQAAAAALEVGKSEDEKHKTKTTTTSKKSASERAKESPRDMTNAEKIELTGLLGELPESKQAKVVEIVVERPLFSFLY
mmetsp:Transcript_15119/g.54454  ORF Transcript_15119/g.54454 Transcript_15119/m.54454 type:complete len:112 (-) Transcript_15119:1559-1894(-)